MSEGTWPCEDGGGDWNAVATSQGVLKSAADHQEPEEIREVFPWSLQPILADTSAPGSWILECEH